jgi:hypothetical protein
MLGRLFTKAKQRVRGREKKCINEAEEFFSELRAQDCFRGDYEDDPPADKNEDNGDTPHEVIDDDDDDWSDSLDDAECFLLHYVRILSALSLGQALAMLFNEECKSRKSCELWHTYLCLPD